MAQNPNLMLTGITPGPHRGSTGHFNPVSLKNGGDRANVTRITHREAKIVPAVAVTCSGSDSATRAHGKSAFVTRDVDHIGQHRTGARQTTCSLAGEKHLAPPVPTNQHGVILIANAGEL